MARPEYILGIDYGAKRIGVAIAHEIARLPRPLTTLENNEYVLAALQQLVKEQGVRQVVVGMPRSMDGEAHTQAKVVEVFIQTLDVLDVPIAVVDETLTSVEAERVLQAQQKGPIEKGAIDAMSAALILERYFVEHSGGIA